MKPLLCSFLFLTTTTTTMFRTLPRSLRFAAVASLGAGGAYYLLVPRTTPDPRDVTRRYKVPPAWTPPPREELLQKLRQNGNEDPEQEFDLLVIGGGATGAGVALDAVTRGLKVALVERNDFSSGASSHFFASALSLTCSGHLYPGTSSKSTKLVHGGVRYLQKAIMKLDYEQYKLVREALHERKVFLHTAPYLSVMQPIMLPVYK
jgi:glycerol-3-phosphate dehydrogenase